MILEMLDQYYTSGKCLLHEYLIIHPRSMLTDLLIFHRQLLYGTEVSHENFTKNCNRLTTESFSKWKGAKGKRMRQ